MWTSQNGLLTGNVVLRWCFRLDPGTQDCYGFTTKASSNVLEDGHSEPRIMISLNATLILESRGLLGVSYIHWFMR